ncbi:MAG: hypothetical protein KatS3mg068_0273 [Candidatus Sericytochromatia bacterium]|nr:MAG: hypothetical protein KatS3mg068_0273 [Candidatus Sericytochromatia bacterium]
MKYKLFFGLSTILIYLSNTSYANTGLIDKNYINITSSNDFIRKLNRYQNTISNNINSSVWKKIPNNLAFLYFWNVENYNSDSLYNFVNTWIELSEKANNDYSNLSLVYLNLIKMNYDNAIKYIQKVRDNKDTEFLKDLGYTLIGKIEKKKSYHSDSQSSYIYYNTRVVKKQDVEDLIKKYPYNPLPYYLNVLVLQNEISQIQENNSKNYNEYYNEMISNINKSIELDSDNLLFLLKKYELEYNPDNNEVFRKLYNLSLKDPLVAEIIGNIHFRNNQVDLSIDFLEEALYNASDNIGLYKKLASLYSYKQDNESLINLYKRAISKIPNNFELYIQLAEEYKKLGNNRDIIDLYKTYLSNNKNNDEAYTLLGEAYEDANLLDDALESYLKAVSLNNKNTRAYNNLLLLLLDKKDYDNLIKYSNEAIEYNPNYLFGYIWLSNGFFYKKDTNKAIEILNNAIKIDPNFAQAYSSLGIIYNSNKEYDKAIYNFEKALSKKDDINIKLYLAETYHYKGDDKKAEEIYQDLASKNPYNENVFFSLGNFYSDIKKYSEAQKAFEKSIIINTNFLDARNNLGNVYIKSGKLDKALFEFEKIININPNYSTAYYNIACVYSLKNDKYKALKFLEQSIKMESSLKEVARTDTDFDNIKDDIKFKQLIK